MWSKNKKQGDRFRFRCLCCHKGKDHFSCMNLLDFYETEVQTLVIFMDFSPEGKLNCMVG